MIIQKARINSAKKYLRRIKEGTPIQIAVPLTAISVQQFRRTGFPDGPNSGDSLLPAAIGPISTFNSEGKSFPRKDLPKEGRYIRTVKWRWTEWRGRDRVEKEDFRDIYKDCYQQDFTPPPGEEMTFIIAADEGMLVSRQFIATSDQYEEIKHCINLFLEFFGECRILGKDLSLALPPKTRRVNWEFLPPGVYPWEKLKIHIQRRMPGKSDDTLAVILDRQKTINSFSPSEIVQGIGGG